MLDAKQLKEYYDEICKQILNELTIANRSGEDELNAFLAKYEINIEEQYCFCDINRSKILVIGGSNVSQKDLENVVKSVGIDPNRVEYILDYDRIKNYDIEKLRNSPNYSDVLVGSCPHKTKNIGNNSSFITTIENNQKEYPKLTRVTVSNELKITKKSIEYALKNTRLYLETM